MALHSKSNYITLIATFFYLKHIILPKNFTFYLFYKSGLWNLTA